MSATYTDGPMPTSTAERSRPVASNWEPCAPIAAMGTWLLEASAGTGKTWQLSSLVARLVVEEETQVPIERILIITFTNAATAELRDRVRRRLAEVRDALTELVRDPTGNADLRAPIADEDDGRDRVLRHLCVGPNHEPELTTERREGRLLRAKVALSSFDLAPISTIHGFCQRMLDTLAFESGQDAGLELMEDLGPLRDQLVADAIARVQATATADEWAQYEGDWKWQEKTLRKVAETACSVSGRWIAPQVDETAMQADLVASKSAESELRAFFENGPGRDLADTLIAYVTANAKMYRGSHSAAKLQELRDSIAAWLDSDAPVDQLVALAAAFGAKGQKKGLSTSKKIKAVALADSDGHAARLDALIDAIGTLRARINPLAGFAHKARRALNDELEQRRAITFDTMLTRLSQAIEVEKAALGARPLRDAIRKQFDVALIDEFQDTDVAQWTVLREVFHRADARRLFLIGDPKQAIYRFRGADVYVYLAAKTLVPTSTRGGAGGQFTMTRNYRSDGDLVAALNRLWGTDRRSFGALEMDYVQVDVPSKHRGRRLSNGGVVRRPDGTHAQRQPLEVRWLDGGPDPERSGQRVRITTKDEGLLVAAECCAREITGLLTSGVRLGATTDDKAADPGTASRLVRPGDIAVLVHKHRDGRLVKLALAKLGVMAVTAGQGSVFQSPVAGWLLQLLDALAQPNYEGYSRALAVSPLIGFTLQQLAQALEEADGGGLGDRRTNLSADAPGVETEAAVQWTVQPSTDRQAELRWDRWRQQVEMWAGGWSKQRFAGVLQRIGRDHRVVERLLGYEDGERLATDFRHLYELCHVAEQQHHFGPAGLADWVRKQRATAERSGRNPTSQRLESDAKSVQIVTTYSAKGLQYPIVMLPFAWSVSGGSYAYAPIVYHPLPTTADADDDAPSSGTNAGDHAVMDLHRDKSPERDAAKSRDAVEDAEERLRKFYVELTRAEHHCVVWAGPVGQSFAKAPINALLLRDSGSTGLPYADVSTLCGDLAKKPGEQRDDANAQAASHLNTYFNGGDGIGWRYDSRPVDRGAKVASNSEAVATLQPVPYDGRDRLQGAWQRASFSSMLGSFGAIDLDTDEPKERPEITDEAIAGGADESQADGRSDAGAPSGGEPDQLMWPREAPSTVTVAALPPLPLATMWGGKQVGTWAHAVLENLDFQPRDAAGSPVEVTPTALQPQLSDATERSLMAGNCPYVRRARPGESQRQGALALATELGAQHGHRRAVDHELFVAALPQILRTPLSVPGLGGHVALAAGYCLEQLQDKDRIDELAFDLSMMGGDDWRPEADGHAGPRLDADALRQVFELRATGGPASDAWDGADWLDAVLARVEASEADHAAWVRDAVPASGNRRRAEPRRSTVLPRIAGLLTGFIDLTFRAVCSDGEERYFIADYKTNKITSPGDREMRREHYTRPWLATAMAHSNYHLQSLIYTLALHRFLGERLAGYDVNSEASYNARVGGHLYLFVRGMAGPFPSALNSGDVNASDPTSNDLADVRGVYADRWPWQVIQAFDRALDPDLYRRRARATQTEGAA